MRRSPGTAKKWGLFLGALLGVWGAGGRAGRGRGALDAALEMQGAPLFGGGGGGMSSEASEALSPSPLGAVSGSSGAKKQSCDLASRLVRL